MFFADVRFTLFAFVSQSPAALCGGKGDFSYDSSIQCFIVFQSLKFIILDRKRS